MALCPTNRQRSKTDESETKRMEHTAHRFYTLLWTQVRQQHDLSPSYVLLNRYWVMAALCDGMVVASLPWLGVVVCSWSRLSAMQLGFMGNLGNRAVSHRRRAVCARGRTLHRGPNRRPDFDAGLGSQPAPKSARSGSDGAFSAKRCCFGAVARGSIAVRPATQ